MSVLARIRAFLQTHFIWLPDKKYIFWSPAFHRHVLQMHFPIPWRPACLKHSPEFEERDIAGQQFLGGFLSVLGHVESRMFEWQERASF